MSISKDHILNAEPELFKDSYLFPNQTKGKPGENIYKILTRYKIKLANSVNPKVALSGGKLINVSFPRGWTWSASPYFRHTIYIYNPHGNHIFTCTVEWGNEQKLLQAFYIFHQMNE